MINTAKLLHDVANCHPSLERGRVWCRKCGATQRVDTQDCFAHGWPKCCGQTMTIDSPDEQHLFRRRQQHRDYMRRRRAAGKP